MYITVQGFKTLVELNMSIKMNNILLINSAPFTKEFVQPIVNLFNKKKVDYKLINYTEIPETIGHFTHVIISASPKGDDIINEQLPLYKWLKDYNNPVLGSCHGHQLMGVLYGSEIIIGHESEEGFHSITIKKDDVIFQDLENTFEVEQHHVKSITVPVEFEVLASSERCKNQIMKHKIKPFYGCQFHVESRLDLVVNFIELC